MDCLKPPSVYVPAFLPENFLNKSVNEPFIQRIMGTTFERDNWIQGDANKFEPDYFCDGVPFEFTIASDRKRKNNFVQRFRSGRYTSENIEQDFFQYISESVKEKLEKRYSVTNVHLCILCLMNLTCWVNDEYGSYLHCTLDHNREEMFAWIKEQCIDSCKFKNVFVIFPDMYATWWVWDIRTDNKAKIQLGPQYMLKHGYPFWLEKSKFDLLLSDC